MKLGEDFFLTSHYNNENVRHNIFKRQLKVQKLKILYEEQFQMDLAE